MGERSEGERRMENSRRNGRKGDEKSTRALETRPYLLTELLKKRAFTQFLLARVFSTSSRHFSPHPPSLVRVDEQEQTYPAPRDPVLYNRGIRFAKSFSPTTRTRKSE